MSRQINLNYKIKINNVDEARTLAANVAEGVLCRRAGLTINSSPHGRYGAPASANSWQSEQ